MIIKEAVFLKSAADKSGFMTFDKPVIAVCGKSNVGKSSFINMLARRNKLAKTSAAPGRTRLVNYFDFGEFVLADLPGYGFAKVSKAEKAKWGKLMETFFADRENITHVFSLLDIRHRPTEDDRTMISFLNDTRLPCTFIATKADKLSKTRVKPRIRELAAEVGTGEGNIIAVSAENGRGRDEVLAALDQICAVASESTEDEE